MYTQVIPDFYDFFCDAPHLVKTTRNCLSNSGSGRACIFCGLISHPYFMKILNVVYNIYLN